MVLHAEVAREQHDDRALVGLAGSHARRGLPVTHRPRVRRAVEDSGFAAAIDGRVRLGRVADAPEHSPEHDAVQRQHRVPVRAGRAGRAGGNAPSGRSRAAAGLAGARLDRELEQRLAGQPISARSASRRSGSTPVTRQKSSGLAVRQPRGIAPPAAQPGPADQAVHRAPEPPEPVGAVPPCRPPSRQTAERPRRRARATALAADPRKRSRPPSRDRRASVPRPTNRLHLVLRSPGPAPRGSPRAPSSGCGISVAARVVAADDAVAQPLGQRPRDAWLDRRDEVDPERAQPRREHRHRNDQRRGRPSSSAMCASAPVRDDVGAADVERPARRSPAPPGRRRGSCSTLRDRDRLGLGLDPPRRHHDRQPLDQVAQDLERRRARRR